MQLQKDLTLIESYDISHHAGKNAVAGCVAYTSKERLVIYIEHITLVSPIGAMILGLWSN